MNTTVFTVDSRIAVYPYEYWPGIFEWTIPGCFHVCYGIFMCPAEKKYPHPWGCGYRKTGYAFFSARARAAASRSLQTCAQLGSVVARAANSCMRVGMSMPCGQIRRHCPQPMHPSRTTLTRMKRPPFLQMHKGFPIFCRIMHRYRIC